MPARGILEVETWLQMKVACARSSVEQVSFLKTRDSRGASHGDNFCISFAGTISLRHALINLVPYHLGAETPVPKVVKRACPCNSDHMSCQCAVKEQHRLARELGARLLETFGNFRCQTDESPDDQHRLLRLVSAHFRSNGSCCLVELQLARMQSIFGLNEVAL